MGLSDVGAFSHRLIRGVAVYIQVTTNHIERPLPDFAAETKSLPWLGSLRSFVACWSPLGTSTCSIGAHVKASELSSSVSLLLIVVADRIASGLHPLGGLLGRR